MHFASLFISLQGSSSISVNNLEGSQGGVQYFSKNYCDKPYKGSTTPEINCKALHLQKELVFKTPS